MPSTKQGGGHTLTFSKKNQDVKKILADKKEMGIKLTDYICEAVRAYENSNTNIDISILNIEKIVQEQVALALQKTTSETINKKPSLEDNLEDVDIEED